MFPLLERHCGLRTLDKATWIYTVILAGVILLGHTAECSRTCVYSDLMSLQEPCRAENDELNAHIGKKDDVDRQKLCDALHEMGYCVAKNVPWCFLNITQMYLHLTHSPHNCQRTQESYREIQRMILAYERSQSTDSGYTVLTTQDSRATTLTEEEDTKKEVEDRDGNNGAETHTGIHANKGSSAHGVWHVTLLLLSLMALL